MADHEPLHPQPQRRRPSGASWFVVIALTAFVLAVLAFGSRASWWRSEPADAEIRFTPIVGGAVMPSPTPVDVAALLATETPSPEPTVANPWVPGKSASVSGEARLHAQPDQGAQVLELYGEGASFEILEPSGDFDRYPVEAGNVRWIRVRTADGLVGWVDVTSVTPAEEPAP